MWLLDRSGYVCYLIAAAIAMACWREWLAPGWWVIVVVLFATGWYLNRKVEPYESSYDAVDVVDTVFDAIDGFDLDLNLDIDLD
jgi:hypothetical protein